MKQRVATIAELVKRKFVLLLGVSLLLTLTYYSIQLGAMIVRFGAIPNYVTFYDWLGNVSMIVQSTPSLKDQLLIINDEWWFEIGYMNYAFGKGISEWSMYVIPVKALGVFLLSFLAVINFLLLRESRGICSTRSRYVPAFAGGIGGSFVALSSITMSWVVCCATPTWVVGLAMMGLGASTALYLEPMGPVVSGLGFILLIGAALLAADRNRVAGEVSFDRN